MHPAMYAADHASAPVENSPLTERECEILNELRCGATNLDIARALFISENTVRTHLYNVFRKLSVKNRTQAVSWANEHLCATKRSEARRQPFAGGAGEQSLKALLEVAFQNDHG